jgi:iron complex outermembrane receptor protein
MVIKKSPNSLDVGSGPGTMGSSPQHQVMVQSSFDLPKGVTFDLDYRYISALPALSVPAYSTANARLAWSFKQNWELSAVGENLFQPNHVEFGSDPGPNVAIKRSVYGKLVWRSKGN